MARRMEGDSTWFTNMRKNPNPQGKGLVPLLQTLHPHVLHNLVPPKQIDQIEMELFTSLFVLQGELKFNPVQGQTYWLYHTANAYRLLMVGPDEWHKPYPGRCIGECVLQSDRTWTLQLQADLVEDSVFLDHIEHLRRKLHAALVHSSKLEDILPHFEPSLCYHGRVMAFILGKSLLTSMQLSGIHELDYKAARGLLEAR